MREIGRRPERELERVENPPQSEQRFLEKRIVNAEPAVKGREFEQWAEKHVFGDKQRIQIAPEHNRHLEQVDQEGLGLLKSRSSDNYVAADGSLWDCKAYAEHSVIDKDQLRDYRLMEDAGYVFDSQGNRIEVRSINYLFSSRSAVETNASQLRGEATAWYVDVSGIVRLYA